VIYLREKSPIRNGGRFRGGIAYVKKALVRILMMAYEKTIMSIP
jgi:hypothetical protein